MKIHAITTLSAPLLTLALTITAGSMALAQDDAVTEPEQLERPTVPNSSDADVDRDAAQSADTDCVDIADATPTQQQSAQGAGAATAQEGNVQANSNAQGAREGQTPNAQIAQNRDDCLDLRSDTPEEEN